jgi:hypothetical protein
LGRFHRRTDVAPLAKADTFSERVSQTMSHVAIFVWKFASPL